MFTKETSKSTARLFSELVEGANHPAGSFVLNSGDLGLLRSLDNLSATEASDSVHGGATIAAHARHLTYGLELMNRWATEGGNPFADAKWDAAWTTHEVGDDEWSAIRRDLRTECERWLAVLRESREVSNVELSGMLGSVAHLAYHLGAVRQIAKTARGPKEGTFKT